MGTAFQERMALVPVTPAFSPFVVHLYGGTSAEQMRSKNLPLLGQALLILCRSTIDFFDYDFQMSDQRTNGTECRYHWK
jgi:hypothetical protein